MRLYAPLLFCILTIPLAAQPVDKAEALKSSMQKFIVAGNLSGYVTFVGNADGVVDVQVGGLADVENKSPMLRTTLFRIASMTKPITVLALMLLVEAGLVDVEDPVEKYLPEFKGQMVLVSKTKDSVTLKQPSRPIAVKDLLTHTSGLPTYAGGLAGVYQKRNYTLSETTIASSQSPLLFEPGTRWSYCNPGIDAVGRIVEVVSGMPYETFLATRIFQPLGMVDTTPYPSAAQLKRLAVTYGMKDGKLIAQSGVLHYPKGAKHPVPAGGLYSTGDDLAKLYQCCLNKGTLNGKKIIAAKSLADMTRNHTGDMKIGPYGGLSWGYGFAVVNASKGGFEGLSPGSYGHTGAYGTQGWIDPVKGLYAIVLVQRTDLGESDRTTMRKVLYDAAVSLVK